jgi:DNA primase
VISLPDGEDPDTFVAKFGAEGFERAAGASVDVFDRKIQILERGGWFADLRRKREALDKLLPTIRVTSDQLLRDLYVSRTSEVAGVSREMLLRELQAAPRQRHAAGETSHASETGAAPESTQAGRRAAPGSPRPARETRGVRFERELVRMLLHQRRYVEPAGERIGADAFADPVYRAIFMELAAHDADVSVDELAAALDDETTAVLQELLNESGGIDRAEETVDASINGLLSRSISDRLGEIDRLLPLAGSDEKDDLIREKSRLAVEIQSLGRPRWKSFNPNRS